MSTSRRSLIKCLGAGLVCAPILAACSSGSTDSTSGAAADTITPPTPTATNDSGAQVLANVSQVAVGAAVFIDEADVPGDPVSGGVVIVQPEEGTFVAFGRSCPHAGTAVDAVVDGQLRCPNHGSLFELADGTVAQGPAQSGLLEVPVDVVDGQIVRA